MDKWDRDVIPGETSRGACFESLNIVFEVGDDHLHDLQRETTWIEGIRGAI